MTTSFAKALTQNTMFRDANGVVHISRTSETDTECKLFSGCPGEFGLMSAVREVGDVECHDGFVPSTKAYLDIARLVEELAEVAEENFARDYRVIARLVVEYAHSLNKEVAA